MPDDPSFLPCTSPRSDTQFNKYFYPLLFTPFLSRSHHFESSIPLVIRLNPWVIMRMMIKIMTDQCRREAEVVRGSGKR